jgi:hypothetical protein
MSMPQATSLQSEADGAAANVMSHGEARTRLRGRGLTIARAIWGALIALYVTLFILGIPASFARALSLSPAARAGLEQHGLSPILPALYWIAIDSLTVLAFGAIAVFIVWRRSDDWMVMLTSLTLLGTAILYTVPAYEANAPVPLIAVALALGEIFQVSFVYLFPNGRFVARWLGFLLVPMFVWRPAIWALVYLPNYLASVRTGDNYGTVRQDPLDTALMVGLFAAGILAQVYRYRRLANPTQRQQMKWLLMGVVGAILVTSAYVITVNALGLLERSGYEALLERLAGRTLRQIALSLLPLTLAFSILRYRLWDIDVIIRRTLVYVPLTAILAGLFAGSITLSQKLFVSLTGQQSDAATVLTTLVVVATFTPIKDRLQSLVDRRFKEAPESIRRLNTFGEQVRTRVSTVEANQIIRRLLEEAVIAFAATNGKAYVEVEGALKLISKVGEGEKDVRLKVPLESGGKRFGVVSLGTRQNGAEYTMQEREALEQVARIVAMAIEQDQRAADFSRS